MTHPGPDLALLLLGTYRKLVDRAVSELDRRGYPGMTPTLHYAMTAITLGSDTASTLGGALEVSKQAAARTVAVLVERDYVAVSADSTDSRRKRLQITELGRRAMEEGASIFDELRTEWASAAGDEPIARLEETLRRYVGRDSVRLDTPGWPVEV